MRAVLISTYDLGRQPFGLASPAAVLRGAGHDVVCVDLTRTTLPEDGIGAAALVAFFLPMHTATRLALPIIDRVRALNPAATLCAYGLYAPLNAPLLRERGVTHVLGPEFEDDLRALAAVLSAPAAGLKPRPTIAGDAPITNVGQAFRPAAPGDGGQDFRPATAAGDVGQAFRPAAPGRVTFVAPDRRDLPPLTRYASLQIGDTRKTVGYTEASRGCKHLCRHCPIVPVYDGRFRAVPADIVLADIRAQIASGAEHITFGDPDFLNGPTHALAIVRALAREFPRLTYDATIKVEHLRKHDALLPELKATGCAFVTTAAESFDDRVLGLLRKGHTVAEFEDVVARCAGIGLPLSPTFVAFTPWTTIDSYLAALRRIDHLDLTRAVAPIQYAIRLLVPEGSLMLELDEVRAVVERFDSRSLTHVWRHPDPRVDALQQDIERFVGAKLNAPRDEMFAGVWALAHEAAGVALASREMLPSRATVPYLNEPWYC